MVWILFQRWFMEKMKKSRRLLLQVAIVTIPLFILMIVVIITVMYKSTVDSFLKAQNDNISISLEKLCEQDGLDNAFLYDYWEAHPDLDSEKEPEGFTEEEAEALLMKVMTENMPPAEEMKKLDEQQQFLYAWIYYSVYYYSHESNGKDLEKYDQIYIFDINDPNLGFVFIAGGRDNEGQKLGDKLDIDLSEHPQIEKMRESNSDKIVFEKAEDFMGNGSRYIGYKPVVIDGKIRAVIALSYNWNEFSKSMTATLWKTIIVGNAFIILLMAAIFVLLYRRAIKPVSRIQKSVCEYIETKDSAKVAEAMSKVKTNNEIGLLSDNISELAKEINDYTAENIRLAGEKERVAAELDMAKEIQASQLPCIFPAFPDRNEFDIYASMTPAKEVGGDFYDFFFIDDDHLALVIADVSGKGIPAALFMMMTKILITDNAMMGLSPSEVLEHTNNAICKNNRQRMFVTVWFGVLEISTGKVTAVNAGHEYPIIRQPGGKFEVFRDKHGLVIGGIAKMKYKQYEFTLQKGSTLFVYTDGVPEATRADKQMFRLERLVDALNEKPDVPPEQLLGNVRSAVDEFVGDEPQFDDLTMLGITLL